MCLPERFREAVDHVMFDFMRVTDLAGQGVKHGGDPGRPVSSDLFSNAKVQAHVQERVGVAARDREFLVEVTVDGVVILGMVLDYSGDLCLQGRKVPLFAAFLPGAGVHLS